MGRSREPGRGGRRRPFLPAAVDVHHRYCRAIDQRDFDLLRTCFLPDAELFYETSGRYDGIEAFIGHLDDALPRFRSTQHAVTNVSVTSLARTVARTNAYAFAQHVLPSVGASPGGECLLLSGVYRDEFRWHERTWRIARRTFDTTWVTTLALGGGGS